MPVHGRVRACSGSTAQQTATTAVGLELGSEDGLDGTIAFDRNASRHAGHPGDRFHPRASASRAIARRPSATPRRRGASRRRASRRSEGGGRRQSCFHEARAVSAPPYARVDAAALGAEQPSRAGTDYGPRSRSRTEAATMLERLGHTSPSDRFCSSSVARVTIALATIQSCGVAPDQIGRGTSARSPLRSSDARRPDKQRDRRGHQQRTIALRANRSLASPERRHRSPSKGIARRRPMGPPVLGEGISRRNLLGRRRRANDGAAVHVHVLEHHADRVPGPRPSLPLADEASRRRDVVDCRL